MPFDPSTVPGLVAWYKTDTLSALSDGAAVSSWTDSSGNGHTLSQATGGDQPLYKTNIQNSLPIVRFDGSNDFLSATFTLNQPVHAFIVFAYRGAYAANTYVTEGAVANSMTFARVAANTIQLYAGGTPFGVSPADVTVFHYYTFLENGASSKVRFDGGGEVTGSPGSTNPGGLVLGASSAGTSNAAVDIGEVLIYSADVGGTNQGLIEGYLNTKWFVVSASSAIGNTVRALPPLRQHILATTPNGNTFRWGQDERRAENNFKGLTYSTTIPGGFETADVDLPRQSNVNYQDLTRLSTLQVRGAGGRVAWEGRLEKTPRVNDLTQRTISPEIVGWQAHLDDDNEASEVYVDRDLTHWIPASRARKLTLYAAGTPAHVISDPSVNPDITTGIPGLNLTFTGTGAAINEYSEAWYDCGPGAGVGSIYYDFTSQNTLATYELFIGAGTDDSAPTSLTSDLITGTNTAGTGTITTGGQRFGVCEFRAVGITPTEADHNVMVRRVTLWGYHGLTKQGTAPNDGLYASDVIANAISRWAPKLAYTTGANGTIQPTSFIIPQLEFRSPTTAGNILKEAAKYELSDWAVWDDPSSPKPKPTFYLNPRNGRGRYWRARVGPSKLQETGPQADRVWNGVIVIYQDVDGTSKSVGPTGSSADVKDATLIDTDPLNPANQAGIKRYAILDMGMLSISTVAIAVGAKFLAQAKLLDQSGSAEIVGHIYDNHGLPFPAFAIRAGDQISFTDANDTSYRRIVHTSYSHDTRTNSIDLDAPPEGMDALLEELSASLFFGTNIPGGQAASVPAGGSIFGKPVAKPGFTFP